MSDPPSVLISSTFFNIWTKVSKIRFNQLKKHILQLRTDLNDFNLQFVHFSGIFYHFSIKNSHIGHKIMTAHTTEQHNTWELLELAAQARLPA